MQPPNKKCFFIERIFAKKTRTAMLSEKLVFKCSEDLLTKWKWYYNEEKIDPKHIIDEHHVPPTKSNTTLTIKSAQLSDAGKYECRGYRKGSLTYTTEFDLTVWGNKNFFFFCVM